jgi:hypothetical protein
MATVAPGARWRPVRNRTNAPLVDELGLVMHVQQGNNSPFGWFDNPSADASSTWWIAKDGRLEQYVDPDTQYAWAQGNGNRRYCSCEFEGYVGEPLTDAQLATAARLYEWGARTRGWRYQLAERPGQKGFGWHGMGAAAGWGHPDCPGIIRRSQRSTILDRAAAISRGREPLKAPANPTSTEDDDMSAQDVARLEGKIDEVLHQLNGNLGPQGQVVGWPELGGKTFKDALGELLVLVGGLAQETVDELMAHEVVVRDPKTMAPSRIQLQTALTRASEAAEARQLLDGTVPPGLVKPTR